MFNVFCFLRHHLPETIIMRYLSILVLVIFSQTLLAQSKKELKAEVIQLQTAVDNLKAELKALKNPERCELNNEHQKASYGLGVLMANNLLRQGSDSIDIDVLNEAMKDVMTARSLQIAEEEAMGIVQPYMSNAMERKIELLKEEGRGFLESNKTKEGVQVTESGLQYKVLTKGNGKMPTAESNVTVHYRGKLIDGTEFDSSYKRNEPATFNLGQVIQGWTEALQLMHEGDKLELYIPYELGYGERGAGGDIPPFATLIFEVELISVN